MKERVDIKLYKNNKFYGDDFIILKYDGHMETIIDLYKKYGFVIKVK